MNHSTEYTALLQTLLQKQQALNEIVIQLDANIQILELTTNIPTAQNSLWECHFQRLVSWLYILYWEVGKKSDIQFLVDLFQTYGLDPNELNKAHPLLVRSLRTVAQHSVVAQRSGIDHRTQRTCQQWFNLTCGLSNPVKDEHWQRCLQTLVSESVIFFDALHQCVMFIKDDESCDEMLARWRLRREKKFSPWDYDNLIREVMSDLGLEGQKQVVIIRNRYQGEWDRHLESLTVPDEFKKNIKRRILDTLLDKTEILMPLDADDIIQKFQIQSGDRKIEKLLRHSRKLFRNNPDLTQDDLLKQLHAHLKQL